MLRGLNVTIHSRQYFYRLPKPPGVWFLTQFNLVKPILVFLLVEIKTDAATSWFDLFRQFKRLATFEEWSGKAWIFYRSLEVSQLSQISRCFSFYFDLQCEAHGRKNKILSKVWNIFSLRHFKIFRKWLVINYVTSEQIT